MVLDPLMVCPAFTANAAGPPHTAARAAVSRARAARRSDTLDMESTALRCRVSGGSSLGGGSTLGSPLGADGGRAGPTSNTGLRPWFRCLAAMAKPWPAHAFAFGGARAASWCRVQGRRGARHNGGCVHPQGAKAPAVAVWTPREPQRTTGHTDMQQPVMFTGASQ